MWKFTSACHLKCWSSFSVSEKSTFGFCNRACWCFPKDYCLKKKKTRPKYSSHLILLKQLTSIAQAGWIHCNPGWPQTDLLSQPPKCQVYSWFSCSSFLSHFFFFFKQNQGKVYTCLWTYHLGGGSGVHGHRLLRFVLNALFKTIIKPNQI